MCARVEASATAQSPEGAYGAVVDLTRKARTLLRQMADESPRLDLGDPLTDTGFTAAATARAMSELCGAGYATELQRRAGSGRDAFGLFDITASGRRTASRLD